MSRIGQKRQAWAQKVGEEVANNLFADVYIYPKYRGMMFTWEGWGRTVARSSRLQIFMRTTAKRDLKTLQDIAETACKKQYKNLVKHFVHHSVGN